jgi:hypothetical protein
MGDDLDDAIRIMRSGHGLRGFGAPRNGAPKEIRHSVWSA